MTRENFLAWREKELERIVKDQLPYLGNEFLPQSIYHSDHPARVADRQRAFRDGWVIGTHALFSLMKAFSAESRGEKE